MKFAYSFPNQQHVKIILQQWETELRAPEITKALKLAEAAGFDKITSSEHFIMPNENAEFTGAHYFDSLTPLAFAAGATTRIRLATGITLVPLQNPIELAKRFAALDFLSGGRVELNAAVGWIKREYDILNVPFEKRGKLCDEYIAAMIELWTKEDPVFEGPTIRFRDVKAEPRPIQRPHIPIWFGGDAPGVLNRVARWGYGWSPQFTKPEQFGEKLDYIRARPGYHGRPIEVIYSLLMLAFGKGHVATEHEAAGHTDKQKTIDQVGFLKSVGVTEVTIPVPTLASFEAYCDWIRWMGDEMLPELRKIFP